jgi:hypothetical protein
MITKAAIALILFGLTSSANAMTVIFKDYNSFSDTIEIQQIESSFIILRSFVKLALTVGQAEDIMMRQAEKITDADQLPIGLLLAQGLQNTFPCDEKH